MRRLPMLLALLCGAAVVTSCALGLMFCAGWRDGLYDEQVSRTAAAVVRRILEDAANSSNPRRGLPNAGALAWSVDTVRSAIPTVLSKTGFVLVDRREDGQDVCWVLKHSGSGAKLVISAAGNDRRCLVAIVGFSKRMRITALFLLEMAKTEMGTMRLHGAYAIGYGSGQLHSLPMVSRAADHSKPR